MQFLIGKIEVYLVGCSDWIALADVVITAVLTAIIIKQTSKLNKRQLDFEEKENQRQLDLQKRQIQVETFQYKREIYTNTFAIFECCHFLKKLSEQEDLTSKTGKDLSEMFSVIWRGYVPDLKAVLWSLREAEYILPSHLSGPIIEIRSCFDKMGSCFNCLGTLETILTDLELQTKFQETKKVNIVAALSACDKILSYVDYIEATIPKELNISDLNK